MSDLVEFLLARIEEDEDTAGTPIDSNDNSPSEGVAWCDVGAISDVLMISPARLRAECEAKRRIVRRYANGPYVDPDGALERHLACLDLASAYADHPNYDEAWRP